MALSKKQRERLPSTLARSPKKAQLVHAIDKANRSATAKTTRKAGSS